MLDVLWLLMTLAVCVHLAYSWLSDLFVICRKAVESGMTYHQYLDYCKKYKIDPVDNG